jgi:hypothetical protein
MKKFVSSADEKILVAIEERCKARITVWIIFNYVQDYVGCILSPTT